MSEPEATRRVDEIPEAVLSLAKRLGCTREAPVRQVELRQVGQMRQDQASAWMPFKAHQKIVVGKCTFEWKARTGPMGLVHVQDAFDGSQGALSVALLGIVPIARVPRSPELDRGERMRYLAELAWAPDAILQNPELHWRAVDELHLFVSTGSGLASAEVALTLDSEGRIIEAFAKDRPRAMGNQFTPTAWRGTFSDYRHCEGRLLPMSAEVGWVIEDEYEPVWYGHIVNWRVV